MATLTPSGVVERIQYRITYFENCQAVDLVRAEQKIADGLQRVPNIEGPMDLARASRALATLVEEVEAIRSDMAVRVEKIDVLRDALSIAQAAL